MKRRETTCPVTKTAELLSDSWTMLIIRALLSGPKGFCELERNLDGISTRTLTLKLKNLQSEDIIFKTDNGQYETTEKGAGLKIVERAMRKYGMQFLS